jgi:Chalcone isomerase-like
MCGEALCHFGPAKAGAPQLHTYSVARALAMVRHSPRRGFRRMMFAPNRNKKGACMRRFAALILLLLLSAPVVARDVDGVTIPDSYSLAGEKKPLVLNGAGYRKKFFVKVYVGALYLPQPLNRADRILDADMPRVMWLQFVRDVSANQLADAWREGFANNQSTFDIQGLRARLGQFNTMMRDVKVGDSLRLELLPRGDTRVWINKDLRGTVGGVDFQRALLSVWLGAKPADSGLKRALLAGKG